MLPEIIPMPHTEAFLADHRLSIRRKQTMNERTETWYIVNKKRDKVLEMQFWASRVGPKIKLFVNTTPSSKHFPRTPAASRLFAPSDALDWLDALIYHLREDIGDFDCTIVTGKTDASLFERKGYVRQNDARNYQMNRFVAKGD